MGGGNEDVEAKLAAADERRAQIEENRRKALAARAEQLAEQALKAAQERERAKEERQQKAQEQLKQLQIRWAEADKHVAQVRDQAYKRAGEIVQVWAGRKGDARAKTNAADEAEDKRMKDNWTAKEKRYAEWRVQVEAERAQKAAEVAAHTTAARGRFQGELEERDSRLEEAQRRAEERRLQIEEEKRIMRAEAAERAFQRSEEIWQARVRVDEKQKEKVATIDAEVKRKAKQAEDCLAKRSAETAKKRQDNSVWRIAGALKPSMTTSSIS